MKIVTLNLWNGGRLFDEAVHFLHEQCADIYFLQEAYDGSGDYLERRFKTVEILSQVFPDHHAYFDPVYLDTREKEGEIEDGQLILSRWPLIERENIFLDIPYGKFDQDNYQEYDKYPSTVQKGVIEIDGKRVTLLNIHGPVNMDGMAKDEHRERMGEVILKNVSEYSIVAGDFNAQPHNPVIWALEEKLTSVFGNTLTTTFNLSQKDLVKFPGYAQSAVDMIFLTPNFQIMSKEAPQVDVSDHMPLVVEVKE